MKTNLSKIIPNLVEKKETPTANSFDNDDYIVSLEVEAFNEGHNACADTINSTPLVVDVEKIYKAMREFVIDYAGEDAFCDVVDGHEYAQELAKAICSGEIVKKEGK